MTPINTYRIGWHSHYKPWWAGWHRPWQAEHDGYTYLGARRAFTRAGAARRIVRAVEKAGLVV